MPTVPAPPNVAACTSGEVEVLQGPRRLAVRGARIGDGHGSGETGDTRHRRRHRLRLPVLTVLAVLSLSVSASVASSAPAAQPFILPAPEPGSFVTVFDYARDGRLVVFDGFTVYIQEDRTSGTLIPLGTLPEEFRGATDPAFVAVSPDGRRMLLGAGAGGSTFPNPDFNGVMFELPIRGGVAEVIGTFPFSIAGEFRRPSEFFFGQGETFGTFTGSIELLELDTLQTVTIVGNIPGDPGGVTFDPQGNLYVGLGAAQDPDRTGEIRRFDWRDVTEAVHGVGILDFDADSELLAQVLNAGDLEMGVAHRLFVGGANFTTGEGGYIAEVDTRTGDVIRRIDPVDGDPDDGDFRFFEISFTRAGCELAAADLLSFFAPGDPVLYEVRVCP